MRASGLRSMLTPLLVVPVEFSQNRDQDHAFFNTVNPKFDIRMKIGMFLNTDDIDIPFSGRCDVFRQLILWS